MSVLEIVSVSVGECEVFILILHTFFFPLGRKAHRSANGVSVLEKKCRFFQRPPL